jgi:4-hydroxybenzoate polyprenyltransferase
MPIGLSSRLLTLLQFTRMALVFTAIADSLAALLIWASWTAGEDGFYLHHLTPWRIAAVASVSIGLYGYGMSLNDIIDRRRDRQIAADRPLPSGRIGLFSAHVICALLGLVAVIGGLYQLRYPSIGILAIVLLLWTMSLITFYDFAGKYLVAPGLLTLGLIRFFHATIPAPQLPLLWHPLLLLNHVTIVSAIAYAWENKRPRLTRIHWYAVLGGLALVDATCIGLVWMRRNHPGHPFGTNPLWITPNLLLPLGAVAGFIFAVVMIRLRNKDSRTAGRTLMLTGLLWLIIYDATFVAGYVDLKAGLAILMLLPIAYLSVVMMRWWSKIVMLSQKPEYQRAR